MDNAPLPLYWYEGGRKVGVGVRVSGVGPREKGSGLGPSTAFVDVRLTSIARSAAVVGLDPGRCLCGGGFAKTGTMEDVRSMRSLCLRISANSAGDFIEVEGCTCAMVN